MAEPADLKPRWHYLLDVHVPGTEAAILLDALAGEPFGLRDRLGSEELERQIAEFELHVDRVSEKRWEDFEHDIEILSLYLTPNVEGTEIRIEDGKGGPSVQAWRIVAKSGEAVRLELEVRWDPEQQAILTGGEHARVVR